MFNLDYNDLHAKIEEKLKDPTISRDMRRAILVFSVGLDNIIAEENKENEYDVVMEEESVGC